MRPGRYAIFDLLWHYAEQLHTWLLRRADARRRHHARHTHRHRHR